MTKTKEELTCEYLKKLMKESTAFKLYGQLYRISTAEDRYISAILQCRGEMFTWHYDNLLEEIKESDTPVEFFQLTKFASIV